MKRIEESRSNGGSESVYKYFGKREIMSPDNTLYAYLVYEKCDLGFETWWATHRLVVSDYESKPRVQFFMTGIANAFRFLHEDAKIAHFDFKPNNLMINVDPTTNQPDWTSTSSLKVIDFGMSTLLSTFQWLQKKTEFPAGGTTGSLEYIAPELWEQLEQNIESARRSGFRPNHTRISCDAKASDIWSIGILLYKMITGAHFEGTTHGPYYIWKSNSDRVFDGVRGLMSDPNYDWTKDHLWQKAKRNPVWAEATDLVEQMLQRDPKMRITIQGVINHPFLQDNDFADQIVKKQSNTKSSPWSWFKGNLKFNTTSTTNTPQQQFADAVESKGARCD